MIRAKISCRKQLAVYIYIHTRRSLSFANLYNIGYTIERGETKWFAFIANAAREIDRIVTNRVKYIFRIRIDFRVK